MTTAQKYSTFQIPKKSGGVRTIEAPVGQVKALQRRLASVLSDCRRDIEASKPPRKSLSHGFRLGHSILTNARAHRRRRFVLNVDLEDFFPSLNFGRVRGFFLQNRDFALHPKVATIVAQIACSDNHLPQGGPSSPVISDLITHILDVRLAQLAKKHGCTYTRYADDLTISTSQKEFPLDIAYPDPIADGVWIAGQALCKIVAKAGFSVNAGKTRMHYRLSRQLVTGLVVNQKINVTSNYYRLARAKCTSLFRTGTYADGDLPLYSPRKLEGAVNFIYYVKTNPSLQPNQAKDVELEKRDGEIPVGFKKLYGRLLFFKYFVDLDKPLVLCEGKTDNIYLTAALKKAGSQLPALMKTVGANATRKINLFNYSHITSDVLLLSGGTIDLGNFVNRYQAALSYYARLPAHPVVVLVDNDKAGLDVIRKCKTDVAKGVTFASTDAFFRAGANLYVVKTPSNGGASCIEDLFDRKVLGTKLEGKTFNYSSKIDIAAEYGKSIFAHRVIQPNIAQIDFSGFKPLLQRIADAIADYNPI